MRTMNKGQQRRMSMKDGKLLHKIFFNKQTFHRCPEIPCGYCVYLLLSPCCTEVPILSTNQRTACVAQTCRRCPFRRLSTPMEEYCERSTAQCGSVRVTPTFWQWKRNPYRTFADCLPVISPLRLPVISLHWYRYTMLYNGQQITCELYSD